MFVIEMPHNNPLFFLYIAADLHVANIAVESVEERLTRDHGTGWMRNLGQSNA
jgi:hypothetical protein